MNTIKYIPAGKHFIIGEEETASGIILSKESSLKNSSKAELVLATGPDCTFVKPNMKILLNAGTTTTMIKIEGKDYWQINECYCLGALIE